jgi:hypothetical protein
MATVTPGDAENNHPLCGIKPGWCKTPHAYFLEWRRYFPALDADLIGIILGRTEGCSKAGARTGARPNPGGRTAHFLRFSPFQPVSSDFRFHLLK